MADEQIMTSAPSQPFAPARFALEFGSFLQSHNVAGLAIGFLIASSTLDTAKSLVSGTIMPVVTSLRTLKTPQFNLSPLLESLITFFVTMFTAFVVIKVARIKSQAVPLVQVVN